MVISITVISSEYCWTQYIIYNVVDMLKTCVHCGTYLKNIFNWSIFLFVFLYNSVWFLNSQNHPLFISWINIHFITQSGIDYQRSNRKEKCTSDIWVWVRISSFSTAAQSTQTWLITNWMSLFWDAKKNEEDGQIYAKKGKFVLLREVRISFPVTAVDVVDNSLFSLKYCSLKCCLKNTKHNIWTYAVHALYYWTNTHKEYIFRSFVWFVLTSHYLFMGRDKSKFSRTVWIFSTPLSL